MVEIKGLGNAVNDARKAINRVRAASTSISEAASAFVADATEVEAQIRKHHDDLLFEAQQLGNSPPQESEGSSVKSDEEKFSDDAARLPKG